MVPMRARRKGLNPPVGGIAEAHDSWETSLESFCVNGAILPLAFSNFEFIGEVQGYNLGRKMEALCFLFGTTQYLNGKTRPALNNRWVYI